MGAAGWEIKEAIKIRSGVRDELDGLPRWADTVAGSLSPFRLRRSALDERSRRRDVVPSPSAATDHPAVGVDRRRLLLQSVLIGGGYSTGREVVEYAGKHGSTGWLSVLVIFAGFTLMSILAFELARVTRTYDYKSWIRQLIGPLWPLFDLVLLAMLLLILAVMISAIGDILEQTLSVPNTAGILIAFVVVAVLAYMGEETIERFKTFGTFMLYAGYTTFAAIVLTSSWPAVERGLAGGEGEAGSLGAAVGSGVLYVGYNIAVYPVVLFCLHRQTKRFDTVVSGLIAGVMMTLPFALTWLCLLGYYPSPDVLDADVPWLAMLAGHGTWVLMLYGLVVGWTLVETSIGSVHALQDRIDKHMDDLPRAISSRIGRLSKVQRGVFAAAILLSALLLSRFGIIALVARGYTLMAYAFIALMAIPLLTIGVARIVRAER
jgi:uncharacterized membrane protein YkvI